MTWSRGVPASASTRCTNRVEPTGTVDLFTTIAFGIRTGAISLGDLLDVAEIGGAVVALRRLHAEEHDLGVRGRDRRADDERQPLRGQALGDERGETVFEDRHLALAEAFDPLGVDIGAHDLVAEVRQARGGREADVAGSDDGDAHERPSLRSRIGVRPGD